MNCQQLPMNEADITLSCVKSAKNKSKGSTNPFVNRFFFLKSYSLSECSI